MKRKLTWVPDLPDIRDHIFTSRLLSASLPDAVDLRPFCSPVEDQGQLGSCTGNAYAGMVELLENINKAPHQFIDASRLFIYYNERAIEHTTRSDAGAYIRDGIKTLAANGWASEKAWPYVVSKFKTRPPAAVYADAVPRKISEYLRITTLDSMRKCLAAGYPFVFGFSVYDAFESDHVASTGVLNMPTKSEKLAGGHAVLCVGYNDKDQRVIVRNSWGAVWGQKGYFTMPYAYIGNTNLADDMWTIRK